MVEKHCGDVSVYYINIHSHLNCLESSGTSMFLIFGQLSEVRQESFLILEDVSDPRNGDQESQMVLFLS